MSHSSVMNAFADSSTRTLIDELLEEQQKLSAIERFARRHDRGDLPAHAQYYRELIPTGLPKLGEQYAFAVDLDVCTGCKACVSACHSLNGLDDQETWRDIGLLTGGTSSAPYQQTVTTACHHCVEPACAEGCPVLAYEKDESTGIVRHLDDQCIGCQYCVLKCPYEVPKYSEKRGIVRKCDMCYGRLSAGEAPACVQACPNGAITIRIVSQEEVRRAATPETALLPGAFPSDYTKPTTKYSSRKVIPQNARSASAVNLRLEHAHWPLIWMLIFTQLAAGIFVALAIIGLFAPDVGTLSAGVMTISALGILHAGLGVSVLHLGRPLGAWRAFLGLRTSWMSREIVCFGLFAGIATALAAVALLPIIAQRYPVLGSLNAFIAPEAWFLPSAALTAVAGLVSVFCSAMIYIDTHRPFWAAQLTIPKFFGTTFLLGSAGTASALSWLNSITPHANLIPGVLAFALTAIVIRTALFGWEWAQLLEAVSKPDASTHRSAMTIWRLLNPLLLTRVLLFILSTALGIGAILKVGTAAALFATVSFLLTFASQLIERFFFFTAVDAPRMPGGAA